MDSFRIKRKFLLIASFLIFSIIFANASQNDAVCTSFIDTSYIEINKVNCDTDTEICLEIPFGDFLTYTVSDNGAPYSGGANACDFDTSFAYTYFTLPGNGTAGPYMIDSWIVDGNVYSGLVANMVDLVDSMNVWNPAGNWMLDNPTSSIRGGTTSMTYGDMTVTQISSSTTTTINVTTSLNPNGSLIVLDTGYHELIFTEPVEGCLDTIIVLINCSGCPDVYTGANNLTAVNCSSNTAVCFDIPYSEIANYSITDNGIIYSGTIQECSVDSTFSYSYAGIPGQGTSGPYQLQNWMVNGSVFIGVFANISELVAAMNIWDPGGNWVLDAGTFTINGGNGANSYSNIDILQIMSGMNGTILLSATASQTSIELHLPTGNHEIIFLNNENLCTDTSSLFIDCVPCPDYFGGNSMTFQAVHCDSVSEVCLPIPFSEINDLEVEINGSIFTGGLQQCGFDSTLIELDTGYYHIVLTNTVTQCQDSADVTISCVPYVGCNDFLSDELQYLSVSDCGQMADLCVEIPYFEINDYSIFDNNSLYENSIENCISDTSNASVQLTTGAHQLIFEHDLTACRDTINVMVACITSENLSLALLVNEMDTFCIDTMELIGEIVSFENICEASSGEFSIVDLDLQNYCFSITGIEQGNEIACLVLCDDLGFCDTTTVNISILEDTNLPPNAVDDLSSTLTDTPIEVDVLANDDLNGPLDTFYIQSFPNNGTAFLNNGFVTYVPNESYCHSGFPDELVYTICNANGCDSASVRITVQCEALKIHNGFSPNGDGKNDSFVIKGAEGLPGNKLLVYNRWGLQVYSAENYQNDWQGTWQGTDLTEGTYFYVFDDGRGNLSSGYVQIHR